jgi:hypothetical protein
MAFSMTYSTVVFSLGLVVARLEPVHGEAAGLNWRSILFFSIELVIQPNIHLPALGCLGHSCRGA